MKARPVQARLVAAMFAAFALCAGEAQAWGHRGGIAVHGHGGGFAPRAFHHFHHFHPHTRVFIGGSFFFWPRPYYPYPPGYAYAPAETPAVPLMADPYWYYCENSAAYYPYVKDCPGGWVRVLPSRAPIS